jgi:pentose-5-phosphate-3-epimerase
MNIIPSLVEQSAHDLFDRITFLSPYYQQFQIDIEDGIFIENKTLSIYDFFSYINQHHSSLSPTFTFDFHFMSVDYERSIELLEKIKNSIRIDTIIVHSILHPNLSLLQKKYPDFKLGVAINPQEEIESIISNFDLNSLPLIQLMTVYPGKQGQPFLPNVLNKIEQLRKSGFTGKIYIDGAINEKTLPLINTLPFKPDTLCPGSYLAKSPKEELEKRVSFLTHV